MIISDDEFREIVGLMKDKYGVNLTQKRVLIVGRLENFLLRSGYQSFKEYIEDVQRDLTGEKESNLVNALTTNHTFFMREFEHFEYLRDCVLPFLREKEQATKDLRIWSAAAATGEEPYTLAMILMDYFRTEQPQWDTKVLATDISVRALDKAATGVYMQEQMEPLPELWRKKYFSKVSDEFYEVSDSLKQEVIFRRFNLMNPLPFRKHFHVVFLRNVMIYFDEPTKIKLLQRIYDAMEKEGYLFIGTTESLDKKKIPFQYIQPAVYKKI